MSTPSFIFSNCTIILRKTIINTENSSFVLCRSSSPKNPMLVKNLRSKLRKVSSIFYFILKTHYKQENKFKNFPQTGSVAGEQLVTGAAPAPKQNDENRQNASSSSNSSSSSSDSGSSSSGNTSLNFPC